MTKNRISRSDVIGLWELAVIVFLVILVTLL
jgi:hypothetical protein